MTTIPVIIEYDPNTKTYGATSPDLPDIYAVGDSRDDVLDRFKYSANEYVTYLRDRNEPLPAFERREIVTISILDTPGTSTPRHSTA